MFLQANYINYLAWLLLIDLIVAYCWASLSPRSPNFLGKLVFTGHGLSSKLLRSGTSATASQRAKPTLSLLFCVTECPPMCFQHCFLHVFSTCFPCGTTCFNKCGPQQGMSCSTYRFVQCIQTMASPKMHAIPEVSHLQDWKEHRIDEEKSSKWQIQSWASIEKCQSCI